MRALALHARSLDEAGYRAARSALDTEDPDDRATALFLATVRRDGEAVGLALRDPLLRRRAMSAAIRVPVPEPALLAQALSPVRAVRHDVHSVLRLSRRRALADRFLPQVHARYGDDDAARLLPACSPDTVDAWLPRLTAVPSSVLHRLARTAPLALAAHLVRTRPDDNADPMLVYGFDRSHAGTVDVLARDPAATALLLERAPGLLTLRAARTLLRRPAELAAALRSSALRELSIAPGPLSRKARRALGACPPEDVVLLAEALHVVHDWGVWGGEEPLLALLPPEERRRAVERRLEDEETGAAEVAGPVAALAPADRAEAVGRLLDGPGRRASHHRAELLSLLPPEGAEGPLGELSSADRPHERMEAWEGLLRCVVREGDPRGYARILLSCERAWHDQEPVRRRVLEAAGDAPAGLLRAAPYAALRDAVMTTTQSHDTTPHALDAAARWLRATVAALARCGGTERAAEVVDLLLRVLGDPRREGRIAPLDLDEETARAVAEHCGTQPGPGLVVLGELLARHLAALPALDTALGRLALAEPHGARGRRAAALRLADPATRDARCAELLAAAPALVAVPEVWSTLARRRTDLVDAVLGSGGLPPHWAPVERRLTLGRWLPHQRTLLDARLARIAADDGAPLDRRTDATALLGDPAALRELVATGPQPVAAAACLALGERAAATGGTAAHPGVLDLLLERAVTGGVRGRAAARGVQALLAAGDDRDAVVCFGALLADTSASVGGRKAAARELAARPSPAALTALLAGWDAPDQHRDVHAALVAPLVEEVDRPGVADRLAARLHHRAVRERVVAATPRRAGAAQALRLFLARTAAGAEAGTAGAAAGALRGPAPESRDLRAVLVAAATDPERPEPVRIRLVELMCGWARSAPHRADLTAALGALADQALGAEPAGRREALRVLTTVGGAWGVRATEALDPLVYALERAGLRHTASRTAMKAALAALQAGEASPERWERWLALAQERPGCLDPLRGRVGGRRGTRTEPVAAVVAMLRGHGSVTAGLAAVQLVVRAGDRAGWAAPWPAELDLLRASPHPPVAEAALLADLARPASA
ncbi:hypothetical protein [uncultured Streptomyces sp.]|uniref:hypothetical protein n=1 Tax=uncultured Streptomyces sp. TaxID=174707 RepID=UPI00261FFB0F|nr:hypothetical protein [uncultured Streptomyces sp.]